MSLQPFTIHMNSSRTSALLAERGLARSCYAIGRPGVKGNGP